MEEAIRVLKKGGYFLYITFAPPDRRQYCMEYEGLNLDVQVHKVPKREFRDKKIEELSLTEVHWVFICQKK